MGTLPALTAMSSLALQHAEDNSAQQRRGSLPPDLLALVKGHLVYHLRQQEVFGSNPIEEKLLEGPAAEIVEALMQMDQVKSDRTAQTELEGYLQQSETLQVELQTARKQHFDAERERSRGVAFLNGKPIDEALSDLAQQVAELEAKLSDNEHQVQKATARVQSGYVNHSIVGQILRCGANMKRMVQAKLDEIKQRLAFRRVSQEQIKQAQLSYEAKLNQNLKPFEVVPLSVECKSMMYATKSPGLTSQRHFKEYLRRVIIPTCEEGVTTYLMVDHHCAHYSSCVSDLLKQHNIVQFVIPRETGNHVQPLDLVVTRYFRTKACAVEAPSIALPLASSEGRDGAHSMSNSVPQIVKVILACALAIRRIRQQLIIKGFGAALLPNWQVKDE